MKTLRFTCLYFMLLAPYGFGADHASVVSNAIAIADGLSEKLKAIGSFQVQYNMVSTNTATNAMSFVVNPKRKYGLLSLLERSDMESPVYFLVDVSSKNGEHGGIDMLIVDEKKHAQHLHLPLRDMLNSPDNPIGLMSFFSKQCLTNATAEVEALLPAEMSWDLFLTATSVQANFGFVNAEKPLNASWLDHKRDG